MNRTQEDMKKAHAREIEFRMMSAVLEELFQEQQEYDECLEKLCDPLPYVTVKNTTYSVGRTPSGWQISAAGEYTYTLRFYVEPETLRVREITLPLAYCKRARITESLRELVLHIVTTYHPNGKLLFVE